MNSITERAKSLYDVHGDKLRFLLVGVWNTLFSVLAFNVALLVAGSTHYLIVFWGVWVVAVVQSTASMKYFAFRSKGGLWRQIGRAYFIYLPAQGLSSVLMWLGVDVLHFSPQISQLGTIVMTTVFSYFGHKYFTFRLPLEVGEVPPQDIAEGAQSPAEGAKSPAESPS